MDGIMDEHQKATAELWDEMKDQISIAIDIVDRLLIEIGYPLETEEEQAKCQAHH